MEEDEGWYLPWTKLSQTIGACAVEGEGAGGLVVAWLILVCACCRGGEVGVEEEEMSDVDRRTRIAHDGVCGTCSSSAAKRSMHQRNSAAADLGKQCRPRRG